MISLIFLFFVSINLQDPISVTSPDGFISVSVSEKNGDIYYSVSAQETMFIQPSKLGFHFTHFELGKLSIKDHAIMENYDVWMQPWGERKIITDHHHELRLTISTQHKIIQTFDIVFKVFSDGLGFRYEFLNSNSQKEILIQDELTEFNLSDDFTSWSIPAYRDLHFEQLYRELPLSKIDTVHTPVTMKVKSDLFISFHEANVRNYATYAFAKKSGLKFKTDLIPWPDGIKVKTHLPFKTPWRTVQIARTAGELITSTLILNLNEPNQLVNVSWIKPGKYIGIWWGMHIGTMSWGSGEKHGAKTDHVKKYIDFASKNGFSGVLVEGWNIGWDSDWWGNGKDFNFTQPHPDFDMEYLSAYAKKMNVTIIGHHETGGNVLHYEAQMDSAYSYYQRNGIKAVKTGYVGPRINGSYWHDGQFMVEHYQRTVELTAKYKIMLNIHEPIKDTGLRRTFPNLMTREGARGTEFDAWSDDGGNPPNHTTILPFTRLLAGPMDFTPGIFDLHLKNNPTHRVNTTLAKQLAYYVTVYSPLQMAADEIENYANQPAFEFIRLVPTDWEITYVPHAEIGEYVTIVRKDRHSDDWFLGSITNEKGRKLSMKLDFLDSGVSYTARIFADGPTADWKTNPYELSITRKNVRAGDILEWNLAPGGGYAVAFIAEK